MNTERLKEVLAQARHETGKVIIGQHEVIDQALIVIFTGNHALIEGVPGVAKTLAVETLARLGTRRVRAEPRPDFLRRFGNRFRAPRGFTLSPDSRSFNPDGSLLASFIVAEISTGNTQSSLCLWDTATGEAELPAPAYPRRGGTAPISRRGQAAREGCRCAEGRNAPPPRISERRGAFGGSKLEQEKPASRLAG